MEYRTFDISVGLTSSQFARDRSDVVARAFGAGVSGLLITGTNLRESQQTQKLARQHSFCWSVAGVHPHNSSQWQTMAEETITELAAQPEVVVIGEYGLGFNRNFSTSEGQEFAFVTQLHTAAELNVPVFVHRRNTHKRFMTLLEPWLDKLPDAALHCFTDAREEMQAYVVRGIYISITDWVCDKRHRLEPRKLLPLTPMGKLLIKTGAPYLSPRDLTPKPSSRHNEPAYLPHILQRITHQCGEDATWLTATTDANVKTLSGIAS